MLTLRSVCSGGFGWGEAVAVDVHAQGVDAERVGDHVQQLPAVADAVGSAQPEGVVEVPVDASGAVASSGLALTAECLARCRTESIIQGDE